MQTLAMIIGASSGFAGLLLAAEIYWVRELRVHFEGRAWMKDYPDYARIYYVWSTIETLAYLLIFLVPFLMAIGIVNSVVSIIAQDPTDSTGSISRIISSFQKFLGIMAITVGGWVASGMTLHHLTDFYIRLGRAVDEFTSIFLPGILREEARKYLANLAKNAEMPRNVDEWSQEEYMKGKRSQFYMYALPHAETVFQKVKAKHGVIGHPWSSIMGVALLATLVSGLVVASVFP